MCEGGNGMTTYNLFISHSWSYGNQYDGLVRLLDGDPNFDYRNYSIPQDDPVHSAENDKQLREAIGRKMQPASCVVVLAGVYATYSKWIQAEIDIAQKHGKRIVAVEYWGAERTSTLVKDAADAIAKWNTVSIVKAIRGY